MIYKVDAGTARALRERGIRTWDELVEKMDDDGLAGLPRPRRVGEQRVGAAAGRILAQARALSSGKVVDIGRLSLPEGRRLVMFDLEGIPPQYEELEKVYLWGMQLHDGGRKGAYTPAVADFGPDGDRQGWTRFLKNAEALFNRHGDVPFVHWAGYEKSKIKTYIERHGDRDGIARRVLCNCFDLLQAVRDAYALPVPSYSLKVIEGLAGYTRTMEEYGGDWSIGRYIRAGETRDEAERTRIMSEILRYNQEDLQATWAVLQWVRGLRGRQLTLPFLPDTA